MNLIQKYAGVFLAFLWVPLLTPFIQSAFLDSLVVSYVLFYLNYLAMILFILFNVAMIAHFLSNKSLNEQRKSKWIIAFFILNVITCIFYYFLVFRKTEKDQYKNEKGELGSGRNN